MLGYDIYFKNFIKPTCMKWTFVSINNKKKRLYSVMIIYKKWILIKSANSVENCIKYRNQRDSTQKGH